MGIVGSAPAENKLDRSTLKIVSMSQMALDENLVSCFSPESSMKYFWLSVINKNAQLRSEFGVREFRLQIRQFRSREICDYWCDLSVIHPHRAKAKDTIMNRQSIEYYKANSGTFIIFLDQTRFLNCDWFRCSYRAFFTSADHHHWSIIHPKMISTTGSPKANSGNLALIECWFKQQARLSKRILVNSVSSASRNDGIGSAITSQHGFVCIPTKERYYICIHSFC